MNKKKLDRLMPYGIPRYVRIYRDFKIGKGVLDTCVVFTGLYAKPLGLHTILWGTVKKAGNGTSWNTTTSDRIIDRYPSGGPVKIGGMFKELGRRCDFNEVPESIKIEIVGTYAKLWGLVYEDAIKHWRDNEAGNGYMG